MSLYMFRACSFATRKTPSLGTRCVTESHSSHGEEHADLRDAEVQRSIGNEIYICSCSFKPNSLGEVPRFWSFWFR